MIGEQPRFELSTQLHASRRQTDALHAAVRALLDELDPDRGRIADLSVRTASLDDVFLTLTGHTAAANPESETTDD